MAGNVHINVCVKVYVIIVEYKIQIEVGDKRMEYGMVSLLIPNEYENVFFSRAKHTMQDAANALQWNLYKGLCENIGHNIPLFNLLPCGSYPQYYSSPFIPRFSFSDNGHNLPFCNVKLVRNCFKTRALKNALMKWCSSGTEQKTLFVYTISQPLLAAVSSVKRKYPHLHICVIVADLPNMANLSSRQSLLLRAFSKKRAKDSYSLLTCVDSFVLLTKHMADYMHITKPFCVMEGIASENPDNKHEAIKHQKGEKIVLYTGTLHRKFGILHLLEAFRKTTDPNMRLVICGIGDSEKDIIEACKQDKRIDYCGQLHRNEILALQKKASVLVNPRLNNEEYTKYSFPSKTMEYLASGVPVVAYKLDGIPDEYDAFLTYPEDNTADSLAVAIESICFMDIESARKLGEAGRNYVLTNKNAVAQTKRILRLVQTQQ